MWQKQSVEVMDGVSRAEVMSSLWNSELMSLATTNRLRSLYFQVQSAMMLWSPSSSEYLQLEDILASLRLAEVKVSNSLSLLVDLKGRVGLIPKPRWNRWLRVFTGPSLVTTRSPNLPPDGNDDDGAPF